MPYLANHRTKLKRQLIDSARRLLNRQGFESVSLQQIMAGAGPTRGGFYSYFRSKNDLYPEVLGVLLHGSHLKKLLGRRPR